MIELFVVCPRCGKYIREEEPSWDISVYHNICEECRKRFENRVKELTENLQKIQVNEHKKDSRKY
jgi:translation initiation factor 2 beta subunit (eIF-2beta)/eIF-5